MEDGRVSVVIPALDAARTLPATLAELDQGRRAGVVHERGGRLAVEVQHHVVVHPAARAGPTQRACICA